MCTTCAYYSLPAKLVSEIQSASSSSSVGELIGGAKIGKTDYKVVLSISPSCSLSSTMMKPVIVAAIVSLAAVGPSADASMASMLDKNNDGFIEKVLFIY